MARKLRWTLDFKSANETGCHLDIYKEGYTGSTVTELVGAANPFEYEEDNDTNLLNFIRYKTGYIRVLETTYGDLSELAPSSITAHYVVAKYGGVVVFTGYMQCIELSNDWEAGPRVLEFPVISPLGLLSAFNFTPPSNPTMTTVGALLKEVLDTLNPYVSGDVTKQGYQKVMWPGDTNWPWDAKIHTQVVCPFNSEFQHWSTAADLYATRDFQYLVDGICSCFGWMVHDTPEYLVFSQFDTTGKYSQMAVANLASPSGRSDWSQDTYQNEYYYQFSNNDSNYTVRRPLKEIDVSIDGEGIRKKSLSTEHAITHGTPQAGWGAVQNQGFRAVSMEQVGPEVEADYMSYPIIDGAGGIQYKGTYPYAVGFFDQHSTNVSLTDGWVIKYDTGWANDTCLLKAKFYGLITGDKSSGQCLLKLRAEYGTDLADMKDKDYSNIQLNMVIKIGDKYINITNLQLSNSIIYNPITILGSTGAVSPNMSLAINNVSYRLCDADGIVITPYAGWPQYLFDSVEISLHKSSLTTSLANGSYIRITELSLNNPSDPIDNYVPDSYHKKSIKIEGNETGTESGSITANFNNYSDCICEHSIMNANNSITGSCPQYAYMFTPQMFVETKVKKYRDSVPGPIEYTEKWIVNGTSGPVWRIIARSFCLWDDEYRVTFARTRTLT